VTIDHLVYGAPDLDAAIDELEALLGVRAVPGGKHPGAGTHNALLSLGGGSYLEIIAPDPEQDPPTDRPMPFGLDNLEKARLVTWALQVDDVAARVERSRQMGYDPGDPRPMSREVPAGETLNWTLTRAPEPEGDGLVPFLIDWGTTAHPSATAPEGCTLVRLRGEHPNAAHVLDALLALDTMDITVIPGPEPALIAIIDSPKGEVELR
jgi:hypothetical protein